MKLYVSDLATIAGLNPYETPLQLYYKKKNKTVTEKTERQEIGEEIECFIADLFAMKTGLELETDKSTISHPDYPFITGKTDRIIAFDPDNKGILEIKNVSEYKRSDWESKAPDYYLVQLQAYLFIKGYSQGVLAALVGGNSFVSYDYEINKEWILSIFEMAKHFYENNLMANKPPRPETDEDLKLLYPKTEPVEKDISLEIEVLQAMEEIKRINLNISKLQKEKESFEFKIKESFGSNETLTAGGKAIATYKFTKDSVDYAKLIKEHEDLVKDLIPLYPKKGARRLVLK